MHRHHPLKSHYRLHVDPPYVAAFIKELTPIAKEVKRRWKVPMAVLIAQGALESNWGRSVKGNAYFGIKGKSPDGKSVTFGTHEEVDGIFVSINGQFRAYASLAEAANDYGRFLATNKRYAVCFSYSDQPAQFVAALAAAGYATDSSYAGKVTSIIRAYHLAKLDEANPLRILEK